MSSLTATTTQLLDSLRDPRNSEAWTLLDTRFRRVLEGVAVRLGLAAPDAADVAQATLTEFFQGFRLGRYERGKGRLRTWILTIARRRAIDTLRRRRPGPGGSAASLESLTAPANLQQAWELEEERVVFERAMDSLRETSRAEPATLRVFELVAVRGVSVEAAAAECGVTPDQAYMAKHRTLSRLRELVQQFSEAYEKDD